MKFKSVIFAQASGSIGGMTFSHNKGGKYTRERVIPVNPATPFQEVIRNATTQLTNFWLDTLSVAERLAWETYAENVTITDRLGEPLKLPPLAMYVRSNVSRLQQGLPRQDNAPTIFNLGGFASPSFTFAQATSTLSTTFDVDDGWVGEDDSAMLIYTSREQNPTIKFFKGPYRLAGAIVGDATTPPTSPADIITPFPAAVANRVFVRVRVTRADGRLSEDFRDLTVSA